MLSRHKLSALEEAFDQNLLASFLLVRESNFNFTRIVIHTFELKLKFQCLLSQQHVQANVLTGLVNLSVDTLFVSSVSALAILQVYAFVLSLAVGFAKFYGIKFKFW